MKQIQMAVGYQGVCAIAQAERVLDLGKALEESIKRAPVDEPIRLVMLRDSAAAITLWSVCGHPPDSIMEAMDDKTADIRIRWR